jgi:hypothetical protein
LRPLALPLPPLSGQDDLPGVPLYDDRTLATDPEAVARRGLAEQLVPLSITTKMPWPAWGLSATRCRVESVLAATPGCPCESCYARKSRFKFSNVQGRLEQAYQGIFHPLARD